MRQQAYGKDSIIDRAGTIKLLLVGCGPAARSNYFPFFDVISKQVPFELSCLVDLVSEQDSVTEFLRERKVKPKRVYFVEEQNRSARFLDVCLEEQLDALVRSEEINCVCIVSEPKAHFSYLNWAIQKELPVLVEKPITAPINCSCSHLGARRIFEDYLAIHSLLKRHPLARVTVMAQRRYHAGFEFMQEYLKDFVAEFQIPISYIDAYYSDGQWNMPHEYEKENHPYKYGYGMLMHSGYHLIDQISLLLDLNSVLVEKAPNRVELFSKSFRPADACHQIDKAGYSRLFKSGSVVKQLNTPNMGELDCYTLMQLARNNRAITTASLNLLHNGISKRAWKGSKADPYRGNGRIKHERQTICVGPLLSLQLHNYETQGACGGIGFQNLEEDYTWNFDVLIYRNNQIVGGKPFAKVEFNKVTPPGFENSISPNQHARFKCLQEFFARGVTRSEFDSHVFTNYLLSLISQGLALEANGKIGHVAASLAYHPRVEGKQKEKTVLDSRLSGDSGSSLATFSKKQSRASKYTSL